MAIPSSRDKTCGVIHIDKTRCTGCGRCVEVCKDFSLVIKDKKVEQSDSVIFGCVGCGHCMMICAHQAITIDGRCTSADELIDLPKQEHCPSFEAITNLYNRRRSVREFKDIPVERELIEKVINAAQSAPMGLPPSDVRVLVFDNKQKVRRFAKDFCQYTKKISWMTSRWFITMMRPFWGKENDEIFKHFVRPCLSKYNEYMDKDINIVNYDAPVAMYFYGSPYSDPADPIIAATYAMLAAESLGLGTCMLGAVHPLIQNGPEAKKFREQQGIRNKSKEGLFLVMGYSDVKYVKSIQRTFAEIDFVK